MRCKFQRISEFSERHTQQLKLTNESRVYSKNAFSVVIHCSAVPDGDRPILNILNLATLLQVKVTSCSFKLKTSLTFALIENDMVN